MPLCFQALEASDLKALITNVGSGVGSAPAAGAPAAGAPAAGGAAGKLIVGLRIRSCFMCIRIQKKKFMAKSFFPRAKYVTDRKSDPVITPWDSFQKSLRIGIRCAC